MEDGFFRKVTIIGVGLIGGSVGLCLKNSEHPPHIVGLGRRQSSLDNALACGAVSEVTTSLEIAVRDTDLIVICTPVNRIVEFIKDLAKVDLPPNCLITDVGSTKQVVVDAVSQYLAQPERFVAAHPLTGKESSGVSNASALLFVGSKCLLTPNPAEKNNSANIEIIKNFWQSLGCEVLSVSPREHDKLLALSSHLPHLLAPALVQTAKQRENQELDIKEVFAGSFRDMTRVASSDPQLWRDIFFTNKENIISALEEYRSHLDHLAGLLKDSKTEELEQQLMEIKKYRDKIYHG